MLRVQRHRAFIMKSAVMTVSQDELLPLLRKAAQKHPGGALDGPMLTTRALLHTTEPPFVGNDPRLRAASAFPHSVVH